MAARRTRKKTTGAVDPDSAPAVRGDFALDIPAEWRDRMAGAVSEASATASGSGSGWPYISLKSGIMRLNDEQVELPLEVILLGAISENTMYEGKYDPDNPNRPTCFALGFDPKTLAPPAELKSKQADDCADCWANAFGSDPDGGKGKACGNRVRLVLLPADRLEDGVLADIEGARLRVPVTSVSGRIPATNDGEVWLSYSAYVNKITKGLGVAPWAVTTRLMIVPDSRSQFKLGFGFGGPIHPDLWETLERRAKEIEPILKEEPQIGGDEKPAGKGKPAARRQQPARRQPAARKKAGRRKPGSAKF
jgi:hypothetical protein